MSTTNARPGRRRNKDVPEGPRAKFSQLLPYILAHKGVVAGVIGLSIVGAAASLAQPLLVAQVIALVEQERDLGSLIWWLAALVVAAAVISGFQHYLLQRTGTGIVLDARRSLVRRMLHLPISQFDTRRTGDLVSRVGSDTTMLYAVMTQGLVDAVGGALIFVGALIAMLILDAVLLGITLLVIAIALALVIGLSSRIRVVSQKQQRKVGDLAASVERAVSAIRTVRAANATEREADAIDEEARGAYRMGIQLAKVSALVVPVAGIALQVTFLTIIGVGGYRVATGDITLATLVSFILFLFLMIGPLGQAFGAITSVSQALGALGRIQEIIDLPSETEADAGIVPAAAIETDDVIRFEDVSFAYPAAPPADGAATSPSVDGASNSTPLVEGSRSDRLETSPDSDPRPVLHNISFTAPRGKRTALVGPSGAGKSTILALIERFYDPTSGVIRFGGVDIRGLDRTELRSQIGYVEQDAPVLAGSLRDNLLLAAPDASDADCVEVLRSVNLTGVLERDERGLDAPVGEDGVMLSGGERQRLAIARTLLAAPPVLLLDESTSSLDGLNERLLRDAIDAVAQNRTLIVIAHRLSTVVDSDQIVVVEAGRVVGVGTHDELVDSTPLYRALAEHQLLA
ncbi:ABC transporter ATP-binding protein [Cryobacterium sp. BB307]|uniref:ABC transporter ATP-binding protein n=1 Tax=Cryobacterium sp. BB307 TaxID=2716317 RepID=UPI001446342F|nr:ABC transporter ATP-binding protein [Cryobacterium sp. BB307]